MFEMLRRGTSVITVNKRLARQLEQDFAAQQEASAWASIELLPWQAWLMQQYQQLIANGKTAAMPLSALQEKLLWEEIAADWNQKQSSDHILLRPTVAAANAANAWQTLNDWQLDGSSLEEFMWQAETRLLLEWMESFKRRCDDNGVISHSRIPALLLDAYIHDDIAVPEQLVLAGFDDYTPLQHTFLTQLETRGCELYELKQIGKEGKACITACATPEQEVEAAAAWASRELQNNPDARIGVVILDLQQRSKQAARIFRYHLHPERIVQDDSDQQRLFNITLGQPLADQAIIRDALLMLQLCYGRLNSSDITRLLHSRFLGEYNSESMHLATLDLQLRERGILDCSLEQLSNWTAKELQTHRLAERLQQLKLLPGDPKQLSHAALAKRFVDILGIAGWPGEQTLNQREYLARESFSQLLDSFSRLDRISPPASGQHALQRLTQMARETPFHHQAGDAPIQVMGLLEAGGQNFDALWVTGMTLDQWPPAPKPNPMLPLQLQREQMMPRSSAARELHIAEKVTERLRCAAPHVIFSHAKIDGESELLPSNLVADLPLAADVKYQHPLFQNTESIKLESLADNKAPKIDTAGEHVIHGGVAVIRDQSQCPFQAFARHRLHARKPQETAPGIDPGTKGTLLHDALEILWKQLQNSKRLHKCDDETCRHMVTASVAHAAGKHNLDLHAGKRMAQLEQKRLERLLIQWLELEKQRPPFSVIECEARHQAQLAGLSFNIRIDRIDKLENGCNAVIDYKSSQHANPGWENERPGEPQLPIYATQSKHEICAAVLAYVRSGKCEMRGLAEDKSMLGSKTAEVEEWQALLDTWKFSLHDIASEIVHGRADPTPSPQACRYCELDSLCRKADTERFSLEEEDAS
ncbi:hypothetical protein BOW34_06125 [Solemya velum gill symbiont]|nr:hypothetical protein BOW08_04380 [Solemya velum gill symbiont]OOY86492.1 hypothetical protein BOW13_01875 [Solemya velum gill symbiont]OOY99765.1 hypothetical protein BOW19_02960 [Solemya velum gill symbiont]OOZ01951.1 hypothetical protein BOW20_02955 [Solemya velum gill symbiont]OOZ26433.1 hypothetical protein BOW32_08080 [Solemya velum gill symbiont]